MWLDDGLQNFGSGVDLNLTCTFCLIQPNLVETNAHMYLECTSETRPRILHQHAIEAASDPTNFSHSDEQLVRQITLVVLGVCPLAS